MNTQLLKDTLGWGFVLWFIGYGLGILLFTIVPLSLIGWIITPVGTAITLWVLFKKISAKIFSYYVTLAIVWTLIAIICDYFFLVKAFNPEDGYYKLDVYLYYALTFALPMFAGWKKTTHESHQRFRRSKTTYRDAAFHRAGCPAIAGKGQ